MPNIDYNTPIGNSSTSNSPEFCPTMNTTPKSLLSCMDGSMPLSISSRDICGFAANFAKPPRTFKEAKQLIPRCGWLNFTCPIVCNFQKWEPCFGYRKHCALAAEYARKEGGASVKILSR